MSLLNQKFGKLTPIKILESEHNTQAKFMYLCECECGNTKKVRSDDLKRDRTRSCGCIKRNLKQDLIGQKFGKLIVIEEIKNKPRICWKCQCDCGIIISVFSNSLKSGHTKSCGCAKKSNLIGKRFGNLIVIEKINNSRKRKSWLCLCDCGLTIIMNTDSLKSKSIKSCGCLKRIRSPEKSSAKSIFSKYYTDSDLTLDQFYTLTKMNCHYCNSSPNNKFNVFNDKNKQYSDFSKENGLFIYNGLDRVDNNLSHNLDNVVPCCKICNFAKLDKKYNDFIKYIESIINFKIINIKYPITFDNPIKSPKISSARTLWKRYSDGLSFSEYYYISQLNCYYCGIEPKNIYNLYKSKNYSKEKINSANYFHNGLDRIDSSKDHSLFNVVPCCRYCNMAKSDMLLEKFLQWIPKLRSNFEVLKTKSTDYSSFLK